jgi:hypothetical protein
VNILFSYFLNTHLSLFYAKLPKSRNNSRERITPTINMQCNLKRDLYLPSKNNRDSKLKIVTKSSVNQCQTTLLKLYVPIMINYFVILIIEPQTLGKLYKLKQVGLT